MMIKRILGTWAVTTAAMVGAAALWFAGAGTALAPEPAHLGASSLPSAYGSTVAAKYANTSTSTTVLNWSSSLVSRNAYWPSPPPVAGQPCHPGYLAAYQTTSKVIRVSGGSAWCA